MAGTKLRPVLWSYLISVRIVITIDIHFAFFCIIDDIKVMIVMVVDY